MIAYKFLDEGRVAPYSGVHWPEPGSWLESEGVEPCVSGVHACRIRDLAYWLRPELWEVELESVVEGERLVVAQRGRLVRRVEAWDDVAAEAFGTSCAEEARRRAARSPNLAEYADDAENPESSPQFAAFAAARLAELQDGPSGYDAERARQAAWLAEALGLN